MMAFFFFRGVELFWNAQKRSQIMRTTPKRIKTRTSWSHSVLWAYDSVWRVISKGTKVLNSLLAWGRGFVRSVTQTCETAHIGAAHIAFRVEEGCAGFWGRNFEFLPLWMWVQSFFLVETLVLFWWGIPTKNVPFPPRKDCTHIHNGRNSKLRPQKPAHPPSTRNAIWAAPIWAGFNVWDVLEYLTTYTAAI